MNLNDLIGVAKILKGVDTSKLHITDKEDFLLGFSHIKLFLDNYYDCFAMIDVELALTLVKQVTVPQSLLKGAKNLKNYDDGEIFLKPLGIVFVGKNKNNNITKFLFKVEDVERYRNS